MCGFLCYLLGDCLYVCFTFVHYFVGVGGVKSVVVLGTSHYQNMGLEDSRPVWVLNCYYYKEKIVDMLQLVVSQKNCYYYFLEP